MKSAAAAVMMFEYCMVINNLVNIVFRMIVG